MIPPLRVIAVASMLATLPVLAGGCGGDAPEPDRPPRDRRSEGPELDPAMLEDPAVRAFAEQAATFLELNRRIAPLEVRLADGTISEDETATWRELDARRATERSRLNAIMYRDGVSGEQRAAMWWVMHGRTADDAASGDQGEDDTAPASPDA